MNELLSLEDVYNKKIFRIPDYQRGYAWGKKQLIDFWDDLISLDGNRLHYTGVLSIKCVPEDKWQNWNDEKWLIEKRNNGPKIEETIFKTNKEILEKSKNFFKDLPDV